MVNDKNHKKMIFSTCKEDRPLIVQFCGNDPEILLKAAQMVEDECDAVDINLGCPQGIARRGHYGSFLLKEPDLIKRIVETLSKNLKVPVTCKIRILPSEEETFKLVKIIEDAGCSLLTVHGRTKEQNKHLVGTCDWDIIKRIKQMVKIPVFANGGIYNLDDVTQCLETTKVDGVMSAEALLENPALFSGQVMDLDDMAIEYIELCRIYETHPSYIRAHLFKMLYTGLQIHTDLRDKLGSTNKLEDFMTLAKELKKRRSEVKMIDKFGWYQRHLSQAKSGENTTIEEIALKKTESTDITNSANLPQKLEEEPDDSLGGLFA
jgi:tRNA-dihydrouridine synthase 1